MKTGYLIVPNYFSPKCMKYINITNCEKIHAISYSQCNFNCEYCSFIDQRKINYYYEYEDANQFVKKVKELLKSGKSFKFTGGEPTLNPNLKRDLEIVHNLGGITYLDTNGSLVQIIEDLINENLINVLAISLKGLTPEEALINSKCSTKKLCWDNVWRCIEYASNKDNTEVIVTYVCNQQFNYEKLVDFSKLLNNYKDVYLKINNYQEDNGRKNNEWRHYDNQRLEKDIERLLLEYPEWKNRVIVIQNSKAIREFNQIKLL